MPSLDTTDTPTDPNAIRTVIVSGLPKDVSKNVLWKKVRKTGECELVYPIEGAPETGEFAVEANPERLIIHSSTPHLPVPW